jgi:3-hydroxyethyl bacteriochlorophyllide a dehydrogenase
MQANPLIFQRTKALALSALQLGGVGSVDILLKAQCSGISTGTEGLLWQGTMPTVRGMGHPLVPAFCRRSFWVGFLK